MQFSNKDIQLFNEAGINVENKNYTNDEVERFKIKVTDFIGKLHCSFLLSFIVSLKLYLLYLDAIISQNL